MIKIRCPHCDQKLGMPDEYAGRRVRCSKCNQPLAVPGNVPSLQQRAGAAVAASAAPAKTAAAAGKPVKQVSVSTAALPQKPAPTPDEPMDELEVETEIEEDPREKAIRLARQQRAKETQAESKSAKPKTGAKGGREKSGFSFSLNEHVPDALRLPVGLALSVIFMAALIAGWVIAAKATLRPLCFVALFVPLAGAFGLKLTTVNGGFLLGGLAAILGGLGIGAGKAAIAQYVVIPYQREYVKREVLVDLPKLLADERYQMDQGESAKFVTRDSDFMTCIALFSLVDEGQADPVKARKWAFDILRSSNKTNVYAILMNALNAAPETPRRPEIGEEDQPMFDKAWERMGEWSMNETELNYARKYFPALNCVASQCETDRLLSKPDTAFKFAIMDTLGLFDMLWILLGMGLAYISICLD